MQLSQRGVVVSQCLKDTERHHPQVKLDSFIVMPNHFHALIYIVENQVDATPASRSPQGGESRIRNGTAKGPAAKSLGAVVGSVKSAISREINKLRPGAARTLWQENYHEHIVRNTEALDRIRNYILTNPSRWQSDQENPDNNGKDQIQEFLDQLTLNNPPRCDDRDAGVASTGESFDNE